MTRQKHNKRWNANRQMDEDILCNLIGYEELSQYDPICPCCWLGHKHTWQKHDEYLDKNPKTIEK